MSALDASLKLALIGNPNCGKTALFNLLTGSRQKVANYAGVTVERREGALRLEDGRTYSLLDLPGTYSLRITSADEKVARDAILGLLPGEVPPDLLIAVLDATNLRLGLRLVLELRALGRPLLVALNQSDQAKRRGIEIDLVALSRELAAPVIETVAVRRGGADALKQALAQWQGEDRAGALGNTGGSEVDRDAEAIHQRVERILNAAVPKPMPLPIWQDRVDAWVMHPVLGLLTLFLFLFLMFQSVYAWAEPFMNGIEAGVHLLGSAIAWLLPAGVLRSLLIEGVLAGVGSVVVFLPQILLLFLWILALEDSGYLPRAAFLLDRVMRKAGLSGRAFIPLLSSFACAIPGIMATRTIADPRERLLTIMVAPLMTCSARLPVYALVIAAFVPKQTVWGFANLQGLTLFVLYLAGVLSSVLVAVLSKKLGRRQHVYPLLMELPSYRLPSARQLLFGLWERTRIFLHRVGTIILALMILLWLLASFPGAPEGAVQPPIYYSFAGKLGRTLEPLFAPIGFNWQMCIALVPGMAAREVAVGALGTVYALSGSGDEVAQALIPVLSAQWSMATGLAFLAWFVYAPQCLSTLAVAKRETNSWRYPLIMAAYLFALAYLAAWLTFRIATALST